MSNTTSETVCSVLIYGRTYEVDYRWLANPDDFTSEDLRSALEYIQAVNKAHHEHYSGSPPRDLVSWLFWSNKRYCVFGILCNVSLILDETSTQRLEKDLSRDNQTRSIPYTFLGYVHQKPTDICKLPLIYPNLKLFEPLCEYISEKWFEKYTNNPPLSIKYKSLEELGLSNLDLFEIDSEDRVCLNLKSGTVNFYPDRKEYIDILLNLAARSERPTSLIIGKLPKKFISAGIFLNIVASDVDSPEINSDDVFSSDSLINSSLDANLSDDSKSPRESDMSGLLSLKAPWDTAADKVVTDLTNLLEEKFQAFEEAFEDRLKEEREKLEQFLETKLKEEREK